MSLPMETAIAGVLNAEAADIRRKQNALKLVISEATVDIPTAAILLNIGLSAAYKARKDGTIPSIKVGRLYRIPTAPLRKMLGIFEQEPTATAA